MPIAINQSDANDQHYEVPAEFFHLILGPYLKYSSCLWADDTTDLAESETNMLQLYCHRSQLTDGMTVLDLGCGWGSVAFYVAQNYPKCKVVGLSNSVNQKDFIMNTAAEKGLSNVEIFTGDIAVFQREDFAGRFDRIISIDMFEHMKNYEKLLEKLSLWMKPGAKLFVHIITHRYYAYHFEKGWMARTFFTGGTMPSHDLLVHFQRDLVLEDRWAINGKHYSRTLEAWLQKLDAKYEQVKPILDKTYGVDHSARWFVNWRMFFLVCSEAFGFNDGKEWIVSHYLFTKRPE